MPLVNSDPLLDPEGDSGTGDVVGPASSDNSNVPIFADSTGKLLAASALFVAALGSGGAQLTNVEQIQGLANQIIELVSSGIVLGVNTGQEIIFNIDGVYANFSMGSANNSDIAIPGVSGSMMVSLSGSGAPTQSAPQGTLYVRTDGSTTNNRLYLNIDGGTTWVAMIAAS